MIVITGYGHSGTRVIAQIYEALGFDLGPHNGRWDSDEVNMLNGGILNKMGAVYRGQVRGGTLEWTRIPEAVETFKERLQEFARDHDVVKSPSFNHCLGVWCEAGAKIDGVIIVHRDISLSIRSQYGEEVPYGTVMHDYQTFGYGRLLNALLTYNLDYASVHFPRDLDGEGKYGLAPRLLFPKPAPPFNKIVAALNDVYKPELIRTR